MKAPAPYTFILKSRKAITAYLLERCGRSYDYLTYRFAWNVKTYNAWFDGDSLRNHIPTLRPEFDSVWKSNDEWIFDDARSTINNNEWTSYPGDDQGDWEFHFDGRSGGWIVLDKWCGLDLRNPDAEDFAEWSFADLRKFYCGIVCADSDFTPAKASREVEYQAASQRESWEEEQLSSRNLESTAWAAAMEAARPDMYQGVGA